MKDANILIGFILVFTFDSSCTQRRIQETVEVKEAAQESIKLDTLSELKIFFLNKNTEIPLNKWATYLGIQNYEQYYFKCYSDAMIENDSLTFFIVDLKCMAGGICEEKRLIVFNETSFKSNLRVALDLSDSGFHRQIDFKIDQGNLIELKFHNQKFENEKIISDTIFFEHFTIGGDGLILKSNKP